MSVTDENGEIVDSWISTKEPHKINNLEEGKKYTLHEIYAPGDYVVATDIEFEVTTEKYSLNPVTLSPTSPAKSAALWSLYCVFDPIMICLYVLTVLIFMTI